MTMAEEIAEQILESIIDGRHAAGSSLPPEAELALEFRASRITIREAIRILRTQNIVRINRGRGTEVNPPNSWTSLDAIMRVAVGGQDSLPFVTERLLEARRIIEVGAVQLAAVRRTEDDLELLARSVDEMAQALKLDDIDAIVDADMRFHEQILKASGNLFVPLLFDSFGPLLVQVRRQTSSIPAVREGALRHHKAILAAIRGADAAKARVAMDRHLNPSQAKLGGAGSASA
jgi:GntR family transcriptional regulator, transcriptional repressor for pyruvate dehydrogenase complex